MKIPSFKEIIRKMKGLPSHEEIKDPTYEIKNRGIKISKKELDEIKPIIFSEISNRTPDKQKLEFDVILNTAINRKKEYKRVKGVDYTLADVMKMPNQYQGYAPDGNYDPEKKATSTSQYQIYTGGQYDEPTKKKKDFTDSLVDSIQSGDIIDNTEGAFFYVHNPDSSITYDNKRKLYK